MLQTNCGKCGTAFQFAESSAGQHAKCPHCGVVLQLPRVDNPFQPQPAYQPAPQIHVHGAAPSQALPAVVNALFPTFGYLVQARVGMWLFMVCLWIVSLLLMTVGVGFVTTPILWIFGIVHAANYDPRR